MRNSYQKSFTEHSILCKENRIEKDCIYEMHWHDYVELEIILSGSAEHIYNSQVTNVSRGHAYIITPHDYHALHALTDVVLLNVCFELHTLEPDIRDILSDVGCGNLYCVMGEDVLQSAVSWVENIKKEQCDHTLLSDTVSRAVLFQLIAQLIRLSDRTAAAMPTLGMQAMAYVHTNFRKPISITEIAAALKVTPNYLGRLFREHTGKSFNVYLNEIRLKYACNMLRFSNLQAREVGLLSGYASNEYFFSAFKRYIGVTPKVYKQEQMSVRE